MWMCKGEGEVSDSVVRVLSVVKTAYLDCNFLWGVCCLCRELCGVGNGCPAVCLSAWEILI